MSTMTQKNTDFDKHVFTKEDFKQTQAQVREFEMKDIIQSSWGGVVLA